MITTTAKARSGPTVIVCNHSVSPAPNSPKQTVAIAPRIVRLYGRSVVSPDTYLFLVCNGESRQPSGPRGPGGQRGR